jgi:predicted anti-sigma-YlaC factor YlaD
MSRDCERARQWTSLDVDGELSTFEGVLLNAHLTDCGDCREFRSAVAHTASALRGAPLEPFTVTVPSRLRRRVSRSLAPAVAALAVVSVGLGSIVASSHLGSGLAHPSAPPATEVDLVGATYDTVNAQSLRAAQRFPLPDPRRTSVRTSGGPYMPVR